ncbi:MAG: polysaccharide pyruvyl transferase family protein [Eubacteriales bacterium]|nr:polysaccharide pyruvyl transferase family protein [Eubacteriales bacterium]
MRIGILTFHNAHNYGAVLQAYALKTWLEHNSKYEVEIINYKNKVIQKKYNYSLVVYIGKKDLFFPWRWKILWDKLCFIKNAQKQWAVQWEKFDDFITDNLIIDNDSEVSAGEWFDYDLIILGSDQIWEKKATLGYDKVYFGDIKTKAKIISYAASMSDINLNENDVMYIKNKLNKLDAISVREDTIQDFLINILNKDVFKVLDPTLLLDKCEYQKLSRKVNNMPYEKYVLVYYVNEDKGLEQYIKKLKKNNCINIIEIHYYNKKKYNPVFQLSDVGPGEFLYLIDNASFVITNSFHGVAFSIIYNKNFYTYYKKNDRAESLMNVLGIYNRNQYIKESSSFDEIDYIKVNNQIRELRKNSENFLKTNIN